MFKYNIKECTILKNVLLITIIFKFLLINNFNDLILT